MTFKYTTETLPDFPEAATPAEILSTISATLLDMLAMQRQILAALGTSSDSRSSVEVKTSTRGVDISSKSYDHSDVQAQVGPAVDAYFAAMHMVQERVGQ